MIFDWFIYVIVIYFASRVLLRLHNQPIQLNDNHAILNREFQQHVPVEQKIVNDKTTNECEQDDENKSTEKITEQSNEKDKEIIDSVQENVEHEVQENIENEKSCKSIETIDGSIIEKKQIVDTDP